MPTHETPAAHRNTEEQLLGAFRRLEIHDGDVLLLRGEYDHTTLDELARAVRDSGNRNVTIWILAEGQTVETMDENQMREAGWVRANKVL